MIKSVAAVRPDLVTEWSERNGLLKPEEVSYGSKKEIIWRDSLGHEWVASVKSRVVNHTGCPYCSHNRILVGFNDFASQYPEIAEEWSEKNLPLTPQQVTAFSNRRIWWKGKCGHEWYALISSRSNGHGCPYCETHRVLTGFNDFASRYPDLVKEWSSRNQITPGSIPENKPMLFWWKCRKCGMEYQAWPKSRIEGSGCPYCSEKVLVEGVNDLASRYPEIASEWDYQKNGDTKPTQVKSRSKAYYWWKGTCGHTWKARVYDRTVRHQGCTKCEEAFLAALPQLLVLLYAHRFQLKVLLQSDKIIGIPIEITIPGLRIAAETVEPGMQQKKIQMVKERLCSARGIRYVLMPLPTSVADAYNNVMKLLAYGHVYPQSSAKDDIDYVRKLFFTIRRTQTEF